MLRTVSQVTADLTVAFPQDQLQVIEKGRGQFSYIPWDEVVRVLDRIFTPFGWSAEPVSYSSDAAHGVYLAAVKLTVSARDEESGEVVSVSRCGFGRGVAQGQGGSVSDNLQVHDTAIAAAGSDALVRATKLLGDAFGLYLYGEKRKGQPAQAPARRTDTGKAPSAPAKTGNGAGGRPSPKQEPFLRQAGYTDEMLATVPFAKWRADLDAFFAAQRNPQPVAAEQDDIPF